MDPTPPPSDPSELKSVVKGRLTHPFLGWYIPCWMAVNWKVLIYAFSSAPDPRAKVELISDAMIGPNSEYGIRTFALPAVSALLIPIAAEWFAFFGDVMAYFMNKWVRAARLSIEARNEIDVRESRNLLEQAKGGFDSEGPLYRETLGRLNVERQKSADMETTLSKLNVSHDRLAARYRTLFRESGEQMDASEFSIQTLKELLLNLSVQRALPRELQNVIETEQSKAMINRAQELISRLKDFRRDPANAPKS